MLQDEARPRDDGGRQVRRGRRPELSGRRWVRLLPALLIAGGLVVGVVTPAGYTAAPFFCAAPLIAASLSSLRSTAFTSLAAVLGEIWAVTYRGAIEDYQESVAESAMVFVVALLALGLNRCVQRSDAHLASVRDISEAAQRAVLPTPPNGLPVSVSPRATWVRGRTPGSAATSMRCRTPRTVYG